MLHNTDIAVVSDCLCHLRAQYAIKSPDICIGQESLRIDHRFQDWSGCAFCTFSLKRHTNSFVSVENNPMRFCLRLAHIYYSLQPTYTWTENTNIISKHQVI